MGDQGKDCRFVVVLAARRDWIVRLGTNSVDPELLYCRRLMEVRNAKRESRGLGTRGLVPQSQS